MENKNKRRMFMLVLIVILIIILFLIKSCTSDANSVFYENLYEFLGNNNYDDKEINDVFLKNNELYDNDFVCETISYKDSVLEFFDCSIDDTYEDYCSYDGSDFKCLDVNGESDIDAVFDDGNIDKSKYYNENINIGIDVTNSDETESFETFYCITSLTKCAPSEKLTGDVVLDLESESSKVCVYNKYENGATSEIVCSENYKIDKTAPTITYNLNGKLGNNDWYVSDVSLEYSATDEVSGVTAVDASKTIVDYDTAKDSFIITATDNAGNKIEEEVFVKVDKTAPLLSDLNISGIKGLNDWYVSDVNISHNGATDNLSGISSVNLNKNIIDYDTNGSVVTLLATDNAGNVSKKEVNVKVDTVAPVILDVPLTGTMGSNNWYVSNVTVGDANTTDSTSGVKEVTYSNRNFTTDSGSSSVTTTVVDNAGNKASKTINFKIDKTAPSILSYDIDSIVGNNDWYKSDVEIKNLSLIDNHSGIDNAKLSTLNLKYDVETAKDYIDIIVYDLAGNITSERVPVMIDKTNPVPGTVYVNGNPIEDKWYDDTVNLEVTDGSDALSGVFESELDIDILTGDQPITTVTHTTKDYAGNIVESPYTVKIDKDYPTVGDIILSGTPGDNGWYITDVKIDKTNGSDPTSPSFTRTSVLEILDNTPGTKVTITTTDSVGRTDSDFVIVKIDKMVPTIREKEKLEFEVGTDIDVEDNFIVEFGISDGTFSCNIKDTTTLDIGVYPLICTAKSNAGLSYTLTTTINVKNLEYRVLEYIESDGTQYVDTGVSNLGDYIIEDHFLVVDRYKNGGSWLFGGRMDYNYSLGVHISSAGFYTGYGSKTQSYRTSAKDNVWYELYFTRFGLNIYNDTENYNYPVTGGQLIPADKETTIFLGGNLVQSGGSPDIRNFVGKRKYFKVTDATTGLLIRHYIPAQLIATGEYGFWELVEGKFYDNQGTGEYIPPS